MLWIGVLIGIMFAFLVVTIVFLCMSIVELRKIQEREDEGNL